MQLTSLGSGTGYLKAGLLGFAGSGKTYTAIEIALGVRKFQKLSGPIAMADTEAAAQYVAPRVKAETGLDLLGIQTRALKDAKEFITLCLEQKVSVAIIDSVTHLWREVCDSYLKQKNEALLKKNRSPQGRLEFQDWGPVKAIWEGFSNLYLNAPLHIIIAGRAGYEYDYSEREDGTGKDLIKTGVKMKTEGEFGYEPSLLVQMERVQLGADGKLQSKITHRATVIKDRFGVLDGKECDNPTFDFFKPFVERLTPGAVAQVVTDRQTDMGITESGDAEFVHEKKQRAIFCEEIQGLLTASFPGQSAEEKKAKSEIIFKALNTRSWTAAENMDSKQLKRGLDDLPKLIEEYKKPPVQVIDEGANQPKNEKKAKVTA